MKEEVLKALKSEEVKRSEIDSHKKSYKWGIYY